MIGIGNMDFPYHKPLSFESTAHSKLSWVLFAKLLEIPSVLYAGTDMYGGALHLCVKGISDYVFVTREYFYILAKRL